MQVVTIVFRTDGSETRRRTLLCNPDADRKMIEDANLISDPPLGGLAVRGDLAGRVSRRDAKIRGDAERSFFQDPRAGEKAKALTRLGFKNEDPLPLRLRVPSRLCEAIR